MRVGHALWKNAVWAGIFLGAALFLGGANGGGCGGKSVFDGLSSDNTAEAKIEKAKMALDDADYTLAIDTLQDLCGTNLSAPTCAPEIVSLYASGFSGRAGLDFFTLIKDAAQQQATAATASFTLFSKIFSNPTTANLADMDSAVALMVSITHAKRTPDQGLQLATDATTDLVLFLGTLTNGYDPVTGKPNSVPPASSVTPEAVTRVLGDLNEMSTGLTEANINNQNVAGHIQEIQQQLANPDATKIVNFLGSF